MTSCKTTQKSVAAPEPETEVSTVVRKVPSISREEFGGTWIIKTAGRHEVVGDEPVELTFDLTNNRIYGSDGCNVINGTFTLGDENELQFGSLISTSKVCRPEVTDRAVLNALNHTRSYKRADNHDLSIKLCNRRGRSTFPRPNSRVLPVATACSGTSRWTTPPMASRSLRWRLPAKCVPKWIPSKTFSRHSTK